MGDMNLGDVKVLSSRSTISEIKFLIPENLDIKSIVNQNANAFYTNKLKEEKLLFICDALVKSRARHRKQINEQESNFAPLSSAILQEVLYDYEKQLKFLLAIGVLDTDNHFIPGEKCIGYCFKSPYSGQRLIEIKVYDYSLKKALRRASEKRNKALKRSLWGYSYLTHWWQTEKLKIDLEAAFLWLDEYEQKKIKQINEDEKIKDKTKAIANAIETTEDFKFLVWSINNKSAQCSFSGDGHRFYNPITNLKKELRQFLTYDGQQLVELDFKNCQPFFVTNLFNSSFWEPNNSKNEEKLKLERLNKEIYKEVVNSKYYKDIITLRKSLETFTGKGLDINKYSELVVGGGFYEYIQEHFESLYPDRFSCRKKVKQEVLRIFYVENRKTELEFYKPCQTFQTHFPNVYALFWLIKEIQNNFLPIILQRIESFLVLDVICKRISLLHPQIPIFTIHDSIITTKGNEGNIKEIMRSEIKNWTGNELKVEFEELNPENAKK